VGISDPREFIESESKRIPFKAALSGPHLWQDAFKNWPLPPIAGWRNWYKKILADNNATTSNWDSLRITQCLELSLAETPKNENLLIAACHFWSNGVNAFLFGHGPMSPTLADVYMMTGLDITRPMYPFQYKGSTRQKGVKTGSGYKSYIQNHMKDGPLGEVEYRAFLNMWLCRFIFCGKANEPTLNHIAMAADLATGHRVPLGKYLLGSVYHMLHQTTSQMHTGQKISCVNDPWWFVQMWLQLYMHQIVGINLNNRHFPSSSHKEGEVQITRGCQTHGEAASTISIDQNVSQLFELFFRGFTNPLWLPYLNNDNLTLPFEFSFETGCHDARSIEIFNIFIHPCTLPAEFCGERLNHSTYEYYQQNLQYLYPSMHLEQKRARAEQVVKESQAQIERNKEMLAKLRPALELKIARKAALETELKNLSAEIEADKKKIAELPGLTEKIQKEASAAMIESNQLEENSPPCPILKKIIRNGWRISTR
jgi:hypothetical protein